MLKRNKQGIVKTILVIDKAEYVSLNIKKKPLPIHWQLASSIFSNLFYKINFNLFLF